MKVLKTNVLQKWWKGIALFATLSALSVSSQAQTLNSYKVSGTRIFKNNVTSAGWIPRGVNMMNQFDPQTWRTNAQNHNFNINTVREAIFRFDSCSFGTDASSFWDPAQGRNVTLHGLRRLVNENRADGKVTILCPFSWDSFEQIAGKVPDEQWYYNNGAYNNRLYDLAAAFKDDTDVWISTWNEPYGDSWTHPSWYTNQLAMVQAIRNAGNNNPIVVGGSDWANSMQEFLDNGQSLLNASPTTPSGSKNIVFDWHAYNYMEWYDQATIEARIQEVKDKNLCMIMGEYGPETGWWNNAPVRIDPTAVQNAVVNKKIGGLAWYFKPGNDGNCLIWDDWTPKNDVYSWYNSVKSWLSTMSAVSDPVGSSAGPNLISNAGFEQGVGQTPTGWTEQSWAGGVDAFYSESGGARNGTYRGNLWRSTAYNLYLSQYKTGLANGNYTFRGWTKSGGGFKTLYLEAKDFGGAARTAAIPTSGTWTQVTITGINVTNGTCRIGVWADANAGNWAHFDDFEFFKQ